MRSGGQHSRVIGERFEIVAQLGAGAMGDVYRARDRARGQDVALKVLPALDATALMRFKNEFRALHDVQHPNLVRLHELHEHHGTWFFTMQLVDGVELLTWIDGDEARLRAVLPQLAQALDRLHHDGLVHRDVKPSNVLVTHAGQAMLLDFGLVAPSWSPGEGAGTPAYMAPEQVSGDISPASDWYSVGVLLFYSLTRRLPFVGSAEEVLHAKTDRAAPSVRDVNAAAPADLAALADSLLARRPQDRPSGNAVLAALGARTQPTSFTRNMIVGRDRELGVLRQAVSDRLSGEAFAISVIGESGIGKTTLLRAFAEETEQSGAAWVLSGRCWERESVPYKGFDGVIDELVARLDAESWSLADAGWSSILAQAFPVLRRLPAFAELPPYGDIVGHETAARVSTGVRWLLSEIAARQPLVVVIDDLQWADRDTLALLRVLLEPPLPSVVVAFGAREPVALESRAHVRSIDLQPLSETDTTTLVDMIVRELGGRVDAAAIARETGGHPLFAAELARHAVATGALERITLEDAVLQLIARLGDDAKRLATVISLAHTPITIDVAARAAERPTETSFDTIGALRNAQLVATSGVGRARRLEPSHDRIRRALDAQLDDDGRRALHGQLAEALEAAGGEDPAALALHWQQAGKPQAAVRHVLRAAEQAEAALAFHRAARLYTWVVELDPKLPNVRIRHAEALAQAGLGVAAADAFLACAREATGAEAIDLRRRAMQQLLLMGHHERALELLDALMRWLDLPNPTKPRRIMLQLLRRRASIRLRRIALPAPSATAPEPLERARLDVLWDAGAGFTLLDPLRAFYFHSLNLDLCFRIGDHARLTRALIGEAPYIAATGKWSRRLAAITELADQAGARASFPALSQFARGTNAFFFGRWRECREQLELCDRLLQQARPRLVKEAFGPQQLLDMTRRLNMVAMLYLGELRTLGRRIPEVLHDAVERNDVASATHLRTGVNCMLYLAFADVETAIRNADDGFRPWRNSRVGVPHFMDVQARTAIDLYGGRADSAYRLIVDKWQQFVDARMFRAQYVHITLLDIRGRAALAAGKLADAKHCADQLHAEGAVWSPGLADALHGGIAMAERDDTGARAHLERAASGFAAADMVIHAANARMVRASLAGDTETATAQRRVLADAGIVEIDRYSRLLLPRA